MALGGREAGAGRIGRAGRALAAVVLVTLVLGLLAPRPASAAEPPSVTDLAAAPAAAGAAFPLTAVVVDATSVVAEVTFDFAAPVAVPLADDGAGPDDVAGDGRWTASLPGQPAGTLVRYSVTATGDAGTTRFPDEDDEAPTRGVVVARPPVDTALPLLDWYIAPADHAALMAEVGSKEYRPTVVVVDGVVYDGVRVRLQGGAISQAQPKKNLRFKMPDGHDLVAPDLSARPLEEFLLDAEFEDPTGVRAETAWWIFDRAMGQTLAHTKVRVEREGRLQGVYTFREEYDDEWLEVFAPGGELYESEDVSYLHDVGPDALADMWDQKEPEDAPIDPLVDLTRALDGPLASATSDAWRDQVDLAALVSYLAATAVAGNLDAVAHNLWLLRDPSTGRWTVLPWDLDVALRAPPDGAVVSALWPAATGLFQAVLRDPELVEMVLRRVRVLHDELVASGAARARFDAEVARLAPEMALDSALWSKPATTGSAQSETWAWFDHQSARFSGASGGPGLVPPTAPPVDPVVSEIRASGASGGDFVEIANPAGHAIDLSGWSLSGAASATLVPGTVIPAGGRVAVPADPATVSAVGSGLVLGRLDGPLPDGGTVTLRDPQGVGRDQVGWSTGGGWPSPPSGGSIELDDVASDNATGGAWSAGPVGGTPGDRPPPPTGLQVDLRIDRQVGVPEVALAVDVRLANTGPAGLTGVRLDGPGSACDLAVGALASGAVVTHRCPFTPTVPDVLVDTIALRAEATAAGPVVAASPWHVVLVAGAIVGTLEGFPPGGTVADLSTLAPRLRQVLLAPGGLDVTWDPSPPTQRRHDLEARPVGSLVPTAAATVAAGSTSGLLPADASDGPVRVEVRTQGALRGGLSASSPPVTPRPTPTWPAAGPQQWARLTLERILDRPATTAEAAAWTSALAGGTPPAQLVDDALHQGPWAGSVARAARLYHAFFARPADAPGLQHWTDRLDTGTSVTRVAQLFATSPEFAARFGAGDDADFVGLVYRNVLGRQADATGLAYWVQRLAGGQTRGWVMAAFSESPEGRTRLAPAIDPVLAHIALLGTAPRLAWTREAEAWVRGGGSRLTVIEAVRSSDAFAPA